jgi:hypothetical protein
MTISQIFQLHDAGLIERLASTRMAGASAFRVMRAVRALRTAAIDAIKARYALFDDANSIETAPGQRKTRDDSPNAVRLLMDAIWDLESQVVDVPALKESDFAAMELSADEAELCLPLIGVE